MRKIRTLGLTLLAMLSVSAVMAASASADTLTATAYPAVLTGETDEFKDTFSTTAGTVSCDAKHDATISSAVTTAGSVSVTPTYPHEGCTGFGFPATIHHKSCTYVFKALGGTLGTVNLVCDTPGDEITITARSGLTLKCTIHVKPQTDIPGTIKYTNIAGGKITVDVNLTGIHYTHTQGSGLGSCPPGTGNNGTLVAKSIVSAETHAGGATSLALSS